MIDIRKRALILTLAATVSVTGSFAAENYKNSLMGMQFKPLNGNEICLILNTKSPYSGQISPMRKDPCTFVVMLPETDNEAPSPSLKEASSYIKSVEVSKMPYSSNSKGYTKILIKTFGTVNLKASTALYIPSEEERYLPDNISRDEDNMREINERKMMK